MRTALLSLFILASFWVAAQHAPEVHKINGKRYVLHVVQPGNTLYGISKLYSVSVEDLQRENAVALSEGLRVNQTLLVPLPDEVKKPEPVAQQEGKTLVHRAQKGETLYAISKKYNCSLEDILLANPELKDGLKTDAEVHIPIQGKPADPKHAAVAATDTLKTYTVKKGETAYGLSKLFGVATADLIQANSGLPFGLVEGMVIRIPAGGRIPEQAQEVQKKETKEPKNQVATPVVTLPPSVPVVVPQPDVPVPAERVAVHIALLLPFNPTFPDSTNKYDFRISEPSRVALSLYRGVRFAVDSLCNSLSLDCKVHVHNLPRDSMALELLLRSPDFLSNHVVIGPLYNEQFTRVASFCQPHNIPVICPVAKPSKLLFNHPNTIKTLGSENMQLSSLAEFAAVHLKDSNLFLINANKFQDQDDIEFFKARFAAAMGVPEAMTEDAIRELKMWEVNRETLQMRFPTPGMYTLIVPTDNGVFITRLLAGLYNFNFDMRGRYRFRVVGLESWQRRDGDLDINHLHSLNVTIPLSAHLDFNRPEVVEFFKDYNHAHGMDPDHYVVQGFDMARWVLQSVQRGTNQWSDSANVYQGILSNYHFNRVMPTSGRENSFVRFYEYENYRLKEIGSWPQPKK